MVDRVSDAVVFMRLTLRNGEYVTAEAIGERLKLEKADVHRAFRLLSREPGWSFTPSNSTPYWRQRGPNTSRGREKGQPYRHDAAEPDWSRTYYLVRRG